MRIKNLNIIDCTLRDGGYYNNWDFSNILVNDYLKSMALSGIRYVELGFRSLNKKGFKGPTWYTTDNYINNLNVPKKLKLGVMINMSEFLYSGRQLKKKADLLFKKKNKSKISFVRIAAHYKEFTLALEMCHLLQLKGYFVCINLMQISEQSNENINLLLKKLNKIKPDVLYFADSLGSLKSSDINKIVKNLRLNWDGPIGIHAHDNLEEALSNTITAIKTGVTWLDSTITGMGRGPGNAKTEYLILEVEKHLKQKINILPITNLIKKHFADLKKYYNWGTNTFYYLAGKYGIHPTYIQEMLSIKLDEIDILEAINQLKKSKGNKYDINLVRSEFQKPIKLIRGSWMPEKKIKGKEVLLIASGPKLAEYKKEVENYIFEKKPIVIALNTLTKIKKELIDFYLSCNPLRLIADVKLYKSIKSPLIVPKSMLSDFHKKKFKNHKLLNYGIGLQDNKFEFKKDSAFIPKLYNVAYALSIATSGKASRILLAGFDGFGEKDKRTKVVNEIFISYTSNKNSRPIISITPTSYNFNTTSIYALK
jgi:4-hydroxy 2-oxovalerate aldolase